MIGGVKCLTLDVSMQPLLVDSCMGKHCHAEEFYVCLDEHEAILGSVCKVSCHMVISVDSNDAVKNSVWSMLSVPNDGYHNFSCQDFESFGIGGSYACTP